MLLATNNFSTCFLVLLVEELHCADISFPSPTRFKEFAPQLHAAGQKALVVIVTDGEASDGSVADAIRPLKNLPVWIIVRLCTDQSNVVSYWNAIDAELELNMDVLDDLCGEAEEIYKLNKWLTYGEPLQRLREFGCSVKEFDLLDEKKLSLEKVGKVCSAIFGGSLPHPEADWNGFIAAVTAANASAPPVWNPVTRQMDVWVNTAHLQAAYKTDIVQNTAEYIQNTGAQLKAEYIQNSGVQHMAAYKADMAQQHKAGNKKSSGCCGCIIA